MADNGIRGVIPILATPFDNKGNLDTDSLRSLVEFNIEAGVHGLGIALGSEIFKLTDEERDTMTSVVVEAVRGRVPVVVNTGAAGTVVAVCYSRRAQELGADAVMVIPPSFIPLGPLEMRAYYRAISDALEIPIMIQDHPSGPVPPGMLRQIAWESSRVLYCKVEVPPTASRVKLAVQESGGEVGILGGSGGSYFIEELHRGSIGTMPGCSIPASFVRVWDHFQGGRETEAMTTFLEEIVPINRLSGHGFDVFFHVHKQILVRRGVIDSAHVRQPSAPLDDFVQRELDATLEQMF